MLPPESEFLPVGPFPVSLGWNSANWSAVTGRKPVVERHRPLLRLVGVVDPFCKELLSGSGQLVAHFLDPWLEALPGKEL